MGLLLRLRRVWWMMGREGLFDLELAGAMTVAGEGGEGVGWWFGGGWGGVGEL